MTTVRYITYGLTSQEEQVVYDFINRQTNTRYILTNDIDDAETIILHDSRGVAGASKGEIIGKYISKKNIISSNSIISYFDNNATIEEKAFKNLYSQLISKDKDTVHLAKCMLDKLSFKVYGDFQLLFGSLSFIKQEYLSKYFQRGTINHIEEYFVMYALHCPIKNRKLFRLILDNHIQPYLKHPNNIRIEFND